MTSGSCFVCNHSKIFSLPDQFIVNPLTARIRSFYFHPSCLNKIQEAEFEALQHVEKSLNDPAKRHNAQFSARFCVRRECYRIDSALTLLGFQEKHGIPKLSRLFNTSGILAIDRWIIEDAIFHQATDTKINSLFEAFIKNHGLQKINPDKNTRLFRHIERFLTRNNPI